MQRAEGRVTGSTGGVGRGCAVGRAVSKELCILIIYVQSVSMSFIVAAVFHA